MTHTPSPAPHQHHCANADGAPLASPSSAVPTPLNERCARYDALNLVSHPVWIFDIDQRKVYWANQAAVTLWDASDLQALCARDLGCDMSESVARRLLQYQIDFNTQDAVFNEQWTLYPGDTPVSLHVRFNGHRLADGRMAMLCHAKPITSETPESLRSVEALLHTPVMITLYDWGGAPLYCNPAARASVSLMGQSLQDRIIDSRAYLRLMATLQVQQLATFTLQVRTLQGEQWHELSAQRCRDAVTGSDAILVSEANVSALKRTEAQAQFAALHDSLTGLPNRAHVIQRFVGAMEEVSRAGEQAALIFIDLDHFKDINDTLGHAAGDELLIHVARRLRHATRSVDLVARLGGDEFMILLSARDIDTEVSNIRERVLQSVSQPLALRGTTVHVTPTMGVALYPRDGADLETLLRKADLAMYSGKESGRNVMAYYHEDLSVAVTERTALEADLHLAFERDEFELHYQPLVCAQDQRIVGAEALVRWRHPQRGLLTADAFVPLCESNGMILALGRLVFERAVQQQVAWAQAGHVLKVHVNLSPRQFMDPLLTSQMQDTLVRAHCAPQHIGIEVTESMLMGNDDRPAAVLRAITVLGLSIALDDFGTGYSNLAYLQRYPIDTLKIDKTFIQSSGPEKPLADLIVALCRSLGVRIVAEGVETQAQLDWVRSRGIEQIQGYWFAKALPPSEFRRLLHHTTGQTESLLF